MANRDQFTLAALNAGLPVAAAYEAMARKSHALVAVTSQYSARGISGRADTGAGYPAHCHTDPRPESFLVCDQYGDGTPPGGLSPAICSALRRSCERHTQNHTFYPVSTGAAKKLRFTPSIAIPQ